jgi:hypothetical protein
MANPRPGYAFPGRDWPVWGTDARGGGVGRYRVHRPPRRPPAQEAQPRTRHRRGMDDAGELRVSEGEGRARGPWSACSALWLGVLVVGDVDELVHHGEVGRRLPLPRLRPRARLLTPAVAARYRRSEIMGITDITWDHGITDLGCHAAASPCSPRATHCPAAGSRQPICSAKATMMPAGPRR